MEIFRTEVTRTQRLSPDLVRVSFALSDFPTTGIGDEYVRLFFPHGEDRREVSLPVPDGDHWKTPQGQPDAPLRTYTVRAVRPDEIDIDFVVHDGGIAAAWALAAAPGDVLGLNSPAGLYTAPDDLEWQLLACDLTGLPAVARILETTPPQVSTRVVAEVPGPGSKIELTGPGEVHVTWVTAGNWIAPSQLAEIVRAAAPPERSMDGGYVWVAGPTPELRDVRRYLRKERGLGADRYKVVGYWTPNGEQWMERFGGLPDEVRTRLLAMWDDDSRDAEDIQDDYETELERLGL